MKGSILLETNIQGHICTNCNRETVTKWRGNVERTLGSLQPSFFNRQKISVELKFWISQARLRSQRNDLDNLVKPILDSMKKIGMITDDAEIFHLDVTKFPTTSEEEIRLVVKEWN
jgi:Holliday junction resolvase RusA-like endonuclease